jgi:hypothetical protein
MSRCFNYYEAWQSVELKCPLGHWAGTFKQGAVSYHRDLMDCSCPICDPMSNSILAIVNYPTLDEMRRSGDESAIARAERIEDFQRTFSDGKLKDKDQLPTLDPAPFTLIWDFVDVNDERFTVIRYEDLALFSEPALWEGYERFAAVCKIVRKKYGSRVKDLVPSLGSELYLYGDALWSPDFVASIRRTTFMPNSPDNA